MPVEPVASPVAELVGQAVQGAAPVASLNVPGVHAEGTSPLGPVNPAAATHTVLPVPAVAVYFPAPQFAQVDTAVAPTVILYWPAPHLAVDQKRQSQEM